MQLNPTLTALAAKAVEGETQIELAPGSDYQGDLVLSWDGKRFHADLIVYSEPRVSYGGYYDPPETQWREQEDTFEAIKIKDVANWLAEEWGFDLAK
jgi:hypothetical protein